MKFSWNLIGNADQRFIWIEATSDEDGLALLNLLFKLLNKQECIQSKAQRDRNIEVETLTIWFRNDLQERIQDFP